MKSEDVNQLIGEKIRHYRKARNLTIVDLAEKLHLSKSAVSKYERGEIPVTIEQLLRISKALEIDMMLLLDDFTVYEQSSFFDRSVILKDDYKILYTYSYTGHDKAYLSKSVLLLGTETAILYGEVDSEENYQKCLYYYTGTVKAGPFNRRLFLQNPLNEEDIIILDIHKPLGHYTFQYGICISLSTGVYFPLACRWLSSEKPVRDKDFLKSVLEFSRDDLKRFKQLGVFFVLLKDSRLDVPDADQ